MTGAEPKKVAPMPKGVKKGGSIFPRVALMDCLGYAKKLVSKTHTTPQTQDVLFSGVVGAKFSRGEVRISALKQYGFLAGDRKSGYTATDLAKRIVAAPPEELQSAHREAALKPTIFRRLFETFQSDAVTKAKLKQRAADLNVHPDETGTCIELYVASLSLAGLVAIEGDQISHMASADLTSGSFENREDTDESQPKEGDIGEVANLDANTRRESSIDAGAPGTRVERSIQNGEYAAPRAIFNVNVTLDSSLDTEKLQRQLELLKRFGAI